MKNIISFKIFCPETGFGLKKDAKILAMALEDIGYEVSIHHGRSYNKFIHFLLIKFNTLWFFYKLRNIFKWKSSVVSIHLELVSHKGLLAGGTNILIPNQEWTCKSVLNLLPYIDKIWCKSRLAFNIFSELNYRTEYIGFCSDVDSTQINKNDAIDQVASFFTRIGPSRNRGAIQLARLWAKHNEWPLLKMIVPSKFRPEISADNIEYIDHIDSDDDFNRLVNSIPFHIFLTSAEGFGHLIVESMSRGAIVLVTDVSPMNEYATNETAILLPSYYAGQLRLSPKFLVSDDIIEHAVEKAMSLSINDRIKINEKATELNNELSLAFRERLSKIILQSFSQK